MRRPPPRPKPRQNDVRRGPAAAPRHGVARVLSKRGYCSRSEAETLTRAGRVAVEGRVVRDPEAPTALDARLAVDGVTVPVTTRLYLALNKPRGLVTTVRDERGRDTVYRCFDGAGLPWLAPVGRLDKASEGLLLFSNDPEWAARITSPDGRLAKTYHVQIDALPTADLLDRLQRGVIDDGEPLAALAARELRRGERNAWLEIVLDEGRNRHIRRLLDAFDIGVLRLVRVAIGAVALGELAKGAWRELTLAEAGALGRN